MTHILYIKADKILVGKKLPFFFNLIDDTFNDCSLSEQRYQPLLHTADVLLKSQLLFCTDLDKTPEQRASMISV